MKKSLVALVTLVLGGALLLGVGCGGDGNEEAAAPAATETAAPSGDEAAVESAIRSAIEAANANDVDTFLASMTDEGFSSLTGGFVATKEEFRQAIEAGEFSLADPPTTDVEVSDVQVSGDSATASVSTTSGQALTTQRFTLVKQGDAWLLDRLDPLKVDTPEGSAEADVGLVEFGFNLSKLSFSAGDVTFQASNDGQQRHEMGIARLPDGLSLDEALQAEDAEALRVEDVAFFGPIDPGAEATWTVKGLEPGHYAYVCFIPDQDDPEGTPHAFKGMVGEFTVQ